MHIRAILSEPYRTTNVLLSRSYARVNRELLRYYPIWCGTLSPRYLVTAAKLSQRSFLGASFRCRRVSGAAPEV